MTEKLFETALGIGEPQYVAGVDFDAHARSQLGWISPPAVALR